MNKLSLKLKNYFAQINGIDSYNRFLLFIYFILIITCLFIPNYVLMAVLIILILYILFRTLSKNIYKRSIENNRYIKVKKTICNPFLRLIHRIRDRKTHIYRKCPECKKVLRLLRLKGEHTVKCPVCGNHFNIKL